MLFFIKISKEFRGLSKDGICAGRIIFDILKILSVLIENNIFNFYYLAKSEQIA